MMYVHCRTAHLNRDHCYGIQGYYVIEPSGRSCYYNDCPGHMASDGKCYRDRLFIAAAGCHNGFYERGYCYYNNEP